MFVFCKDVKVYNYQSHYYTDHHSHGNRIELNCQTERVNGVLRQPQKNRGIKLSKKIKQQVQIQDSMKSPKVTVNSPRRLQNSKSKRRKSAHSMEINRQSSLSKQNRQCNSVQMVKKQNTCQQYVQTQLNCELGNLAKQIKTPIQTSQYKTLSTTLQGTKKTSPSYLFQPTLQNLLDSSQYSRTSDARPAPKISISYASENNISIDHHQIDPLELSLNYNKPNYCWNRIKHRLHDTDLRTIISNQNIQNISSQQNLLTECEYVIEQSFVRSPNISNNFISLNQTNVFQGSSQYLAQEKDLNIIVSLKIIGGKQSQRISRQLRNYSEISQHQGILWLYQHSMNNDDHILIRQGYTGRIKDMMNVNINRVLEDVENALKHLERYNKYCDQIEIQQIMEVMGVFKLSNLDKVWSQKKISIFTNISRLKKKLFQYKRHVHQ